MKYFDAHTHPHFAAFKDDSAQVIQRARDAGVGMILVGTQRDTSARSVALARASGPGVYAAVGLHPLHTSTSFHDEQELGGGEAAKAFTSRGETFEREAYVALATDPCVVAIGECGLDYYRTDDKQAIAKQKRAFEEQIALSALVRKPLMIHCRSAYADTVQMLRAANGAYVPGVVHFFAGNVEEAKQFLELGFSFTFGGVLTFARSYDDVVRYVPLPNILSETDAPYVSPVPYRGKRNEPLYVREVVAALANIKNISHDDMALYTCANAARIFGIDTSL